MKLKTFLASIAMLFCCISVSAYDSHDIYDFYDFEVDNICYNIISSTDKTVEVTYESRRLGGYYCEYNYYGSVNIPESVTYEGDEYSVTRIGASAFKDDNGLTSVVIPNSVNSIGSDAFLGCSALTAVYIDDMSAWCNINFSGASANPLFYAKNLYLNGEKVTELVIPNGVTSIRYAAFEGCSGLTSVLIPNSVTSIGYAAFEGCEGLTSVVIPNSVTNIGEKAFSGCEGLNSLTIGTGVLSIGSNQCTPKKTIWLTNTPPSGWENLKGTINYVANEQYGSTSDVKVYPYLSSIFEADGVKYVPVSPSERTCDAIDCNYDSAVEEINIGETVSYRGIAMTVQNIMPYIAYSHKSLKNITLSNKGDIPIRAFYGCSDVTNVTISNEGDIGTSAFAGAMTSENATINITNKGNIGDKAFYGCTAIANASISNEGYIGASAFEGSMTSENATINITNKGNIGSAAFNDCTAITNATISNEGNIGASAFAGAMTSENATINITNKGNIGDKAFYGCTAITNATISNEGNIGTSAFEGAMKSANATIHIASKGNIDSKAFYGCTGIKTAVIDLRSNDTKENITLEDWTSPYTTHSSTSSKTYNFTLQQSNTLSFDWWVSSETGYDKLIVVLDGSTVLTKSGEHSGTFSQLVSAGKHTLVVKYAKNGSVTSRQDKASVYNIKIGSRDISQEAFRGCTSLASLTLGDSIQSIGESAFRACSSLTEVKIPNLVTRLGDYCFASTTALKHVELCDSLQGIGIYCFSGSGLESISIPASVKSIRNYAFDDCTKLADVVIEDRTADLSLGSNGSSPLFADCPLDSVYIGGNITYNTSSSYGYSPFYRNTSLQTVVITDKEEEISDNEFYGCTNLKNVTIGSDVKKIGKWAFSGCSNLDYFSFGKSVKSIGQEAFSDCVNLTKLISYAEVPPTCGTMALDDINKWNCVLQVPQSCLAAYQQADQWKEFFFIEDVLTAIGGVTVDGAVPATADVYSTNGMLIKRNAELKNLKHELPAGIYIIGGKKVWVK